MPRLARRLTTALLWIAIALLPLRGVAAVLMPAVASALPGASATAAQFAGAMPCHGAALEAAQAPAGEDTSHTCSLCDLCHSSVAQAPEINVALPSLPEAQPRAHASRAIEPRAPDGLFRPPRTFRG